ncbi:MAG TPA: OmpA family protein [Chitinophagales bacterium]|nr:OmpA family protein [Chitinophagales bacterium]
MKKGIVLFCAVLVLFSSVSLGAKKPPKSNKSAVGNNRFTLGIGMEVADFYSPALKKVSTFKNPVWFGPRITGWYNPNSSVAVGLDVGSYFFGSKNQDPSLPIINTYNILYSGILAYKFNNGYILKEDAAVSPYIFAKLQGTWASNGITNANVNGFGIPIGAGINFKIANNIALNVNGGYNFAIKNNNDHIFFGAGIMVDLGKGKEAAVDTVPAVVEKPVDTDGDGIYDIDDACPTVAGLAQFNGCPDTDGDGIEDSKDECPTVPGIAEFNGCPDRDGDGIPDAKDACPDEKGIAKFGGCPDPDRDGDGIVNDKDKCPDVPGSFIAQGCPDQDGDGVMDADDKCPTVPGPASNKGCPEVKEEVKKRLAFAARAIQFETGKAVIKPVSYKILDEVASILKEYPYYDVNVDGHTDNVGKPAANLKLSQDRAAAAVTYLIGKGIPASRLVSAGYGDSKPVGDNKTAAGRAQNRRVEFNLLFK